ncbi:MAG: hypothetical protein F6K37_01685 [Moorea sp. SIO4E2]|uniref:hypothetical protein n=1 Tax=Moorena sp. SIO4E2 TaxID=2607826 RepID=UPI0013BAE748|nr:hypothetical protein [Moorena sp. SIO4E2]NEQ04745.1 hypothetical protein [Moorena sp. SIO4E2]
MKMLKIKFIVKARAVLIILFYLLVIYIVLGTLFINYLTAGVLGLGFFLAYLSKHVIRYLPYSSKYAINLIKIIPLLLLINVLLSYSKSKNSIIYLILQSDIVDDRPSSVNKTSVNKIWFEFLNIINILFYHDRSNIFYYKLTVNPKNKNELNIFEIEE